MPPRVDYALTPLGLTLREPIQALAAWADAHRGDIQAARDRFDQAQAEAERPVAQVGGAR